MSNNLDEYRVPIPQGSEPEEEPPQGGRRFWWIILALVIFVGLGIGAFLFLRPDEPEQVGTVEEEIEQIEPIEGESEQATTVTESSSEPIEPTPDNIGHNRIAFIDPDGRLATVNPEGSDRRVLTESGRIYQFPAWSPEGDLIAAIGSSLEDSGLFVLADRSDPETRQLYIHNEDDPIYLFWAPDGQQVSFIAQHPDGLALHLAPADGASDSQILASGPGSFFWNWLPDSQQVFIHTGFTAQAGDVTRLAFVPVGPEGEEVEVVQNGFFQTPGVSHDGIYYSFSDTDPTGRHWLIVWNIEDDDQERLVGHQGVAAMGWNPARPLLAYTSPASVANTFYGPLRLLDLDTGDNRLLTPEVVIAFFWSPDGQSIAYLTLDRIEELEEGQASSNTLQFVSRSSFQEERQAAQVVRRIFLNLWVLNLDEEEPRSLITFEPTDVFLNQFLPFFDQYALSHRLWSPDSTALVLPIQDEDDQNVLVVVPVDGDEPQVIAEGEVGFWSQN
jgi:TolB protein